MSLTENAFGAAIDRVSSVAWPMLAVITHPRLTDTLYLTTEPGGLTSNGQAYTYFPFEPTLATDTDAMPRARVEFQNVDRTIGDTILALIDPAEITLRVVTSLDYDVYEYELLNLLLVNVSGDAIRISGDLIVRNYDVEPWPGQTASKARLPGLWR